MRHWATLLATLVLAGCVDPGPSYRDVLNRLVGRPDTEAIGMLGVPDRQYASDTGDGTKFLGWTTMNNRIIPGPYWPGGYGPYPWRGPGWGWWGPDRVMQTQCLTTATVRQGHVLGFSLNGDCPA